MKETIHLAICLQTVLRVQKRNKSIALGSSSFLVSDDSDHGQRLILTKRLSQRFVRYVITKVPNEKTIVI